MLLLSGMRFRGPTFLFTSLLVAELLVSLKNEVFLADVFLCSLSLTLTRDYIVDF